MHIFSENSCLMMAEYRLHIWQTESNRLKLSKIQRLTNDLHHHPAAPTPSGTSGQLADPP